jgi:soluble lytic murein transglycosylase-like protein
LQVNTLSSLFCFVTLGFGVGISALISPPVQAADATLPPGLTMPTKDSLALELGHKPKDFSKNVDDFALALSQGSMSQALKRLCVKDEESCRLVKDFQEQAADAKRERLKARRRAKSIRVTEKNVAEVQAQEFRQVLSGLKVDGEKELSRLAALSLSTQACPRNLSAALVIEAEEYFPFDGIRQKAKELFEHARPCLEETSASYERLYLRQGLYALYEGDKVRAKELLLTAKKAQTSSEEYRVLYWLGHLEQKDGEPKENIYWTELLSKYPLSFYSIEASVSLKKDPMEVIAQRKMGDMKRLVADDPELNRMIRWLEAMYLFKKSSAVAKWASWIVRSNEDQLDVEVLHYISTLKIASGMYRSNISMLFSFFRKNPQSLNEEGLKLLYPRPYFSLIDETSKGKIDTFLVLGLVRQESAFDPRAVSRAKAKGLMQIIPQTARRLASQGHRKLMDEKKNTEMGVKYLLQLGQRFDGSAELVLAAYNAGPHKVDSWLKRNPDRAKDLLLWNDLIPYMETRDYVVSILRNNYLYYRLYGEGEIESTVFHSQLVKELLVKAGKN